MDETVDYDYHIDGIGEIPTIAKIQMRINEEYDKLYLISPDGKRTPHVCTICDEFLLDIADIEYVTLAKLKKNQDVLRWDKNVTTRERIPHIEESFRYTKEGLTSEQLSWLSQLALSPRGDIRKRSTHQNATPSVVCCSRCRLDVEANKTPFYSIVNSNYVGCAPPCLTALSDVELAMITPVKSYGYCFSFVGGAQKNMKGTFTFMRVEARKICRAAMHLEAMGLTDHMVVLLSGRMTDYQRDKARKKGVIRTGLVLRAVEWLVANHKRWKGINMDIFRKELEGVSPVVIDNSSRIESENSNVEEEELFLCYHPDGANNETSGGFDEPGAFKEYVDRMQKDNYNVELQLDLGKEFVRESDGDLLLNACLLQFPYGIGSVDESRVLADGSFTQHTDITKFLDHLSRLSQVTFQTPMFQLIMYSMISKCRLLRSSRLQLKGKHTAETLANGVNSEDISSAIRGRERGFRDAGTAGSNTLLNAVDAMSRALPHTNEASKAARSNGESMQHHHGIGSIFLTVTFDDENSLLIQVLTQEEVDDDTPISELTDDELAARAKRRREIRLDYPGCASMNFEMLLTILTQKVIGWDMTKDCATAEPGLFGFCEAFSMAIEEQGRKTLHAHMTLWIRGFRALQRAIFFGTKVQKKEAGQSIATYHEHLVTTEMFGIMQQRKKQTIFDHPCKVEDRKERDGPNIVDEQGLRDLRHKQGYKATNGLFAFCPHCDKKWTYEEMLVALLKDDELLKEPMYAGPCRPVEEEASMDIPKARMRARIVEFQKKIDVDVDDTPGRLINATYQHHLSLHCTSCFKCQKTAAKKKTHTCGPKCECRMRLPDCPRRTARVVTMSEGQPWFKWNGDEILQPFIEFQPRRCKYDAFQNVSCKAISESKFSCNSNAALITDGPVSQYQFKYQHKNTQDQDTAEYAELEKSMKGLNGRVHDEDSREAARLICRAAFAHNKSNIISAPLSAYLVRRGSRFYFSHKFQYCPLRDVSRLLKNQDVSGQVIYNEGGNVFFENRALHYLCRPEALEDVSLKDFFENYEVTWASKKRKRGEERGVHRFMADTGYFQHPSVATKGKNTGKATQAVKERDEILQIKVSQWGFVDTGKFEVNILTCEPHQITSEMETYAEAVLTLLMPHRCREDLILGYGSCKRTFTQRLQKVYQHDMELRDQDLDELMFTEQSEVFLQNIQDCAYNSMRYKTKGDDLERRTNPFECDPAYKDNEEEKAEEDDDIYEPFEFLLEQMPDFDEKTDALATHLPNYMKNFNFSHVRNTGMRGCGYNLNLEMHQNFTQESALVEAFVRRSASNTGRHSLRVQQIIRERTKAKYSVTRIVQILLTRTTARGLEDLFRVPNVSVSEANGTVESILEWAFAAGLDRVQKRAFECMIAAFVLTFFDVDEEDDHLTATTDRTKFRQVKKQLLKLKGGSKPNDPQLICLLHGPGGSGKSTVINLVTAYARSYCTSLGHRFTARTIVITAMSGVAATLLHGETTHGAVGLNRGSVTNDEKDAWGDARLLIVDEISFAAGVDFDQMYRKTQELMCERFRPYGGLNIVFAGDYSQLEPCKKETVYSGEPWETFHGSINAFIELDGKHRFKNDTAWGERLLRFRDGEPTLEDVRTVNNACRISEERKPPAGIQVATYFNKNRDAVNTAVFEEYCRKNIQPNNEVFKGAVVILMDDLCVRSGAKKYVAIRSNSVKKAFWEQCGEDACNTTEKRSRVDPMLKLYPDCPMMHTDNSDVPKGQANGSRVLVKHMNIKYGEEPFKLLLACGTTVAAYTVGQIKSILVQHEAADIYPNRFEVVPKKFTFKAKFDTGYGKLEAGMSGKQFPLISNSATTGHKLQGCTAQTLLALEWNYRSNWPYVVLSRVTTMLGLYLAVDLTEDLSKLGMPAKMKAMLESFREKHSLQPIMAEEYSAMIRFMRDGTSDINQAIL